MKLYTANCTQNEKNNLYPNCVEITCLDDLLKAVRRDHVAPKMRNNHRGTDDFLEADCVMMDIDNSHSEDPADWKSLDDIVDAFPDVHFYYVKSRNYMKEKVKTGKDGTIRRYAPREKYHIYFPLSRTYTDCDEYEELMLKIAGKFPYFDLGACKPAQMFFGTPIPEGGEIS